MNVRRVEVSRSPLNTRDGDTISFNAVYANESIAEADQHFKTRAAYVRAGGGLAFSINIRTLALTLRYMTGP